LTDDKKDKKEIAGGKLDGRKQKRKLVEGPVSIPAI